MAVVELEVTSGAGTLGDVVTGWQVNETTTPANPATFPNGAGTVTFAASAKEDSPFLVDDEITFSHTVLGAVEGTVGDITVSETDVSGTIVSHLAILDAERLVPTLVSVPLSQAFETYIGIAGPSLTVDYQGSANPTVSFPAWEGSILRMVTQLASLHSLEIVINGYEITIRDMGAVTLALTDTADLTRSISSRSAGQYIDVVYQQPTSFTSFDSTVWNYSENPSLETNASNWSYTESSPGVVSAGRSTVDAYSGTASYRVEILTTGNDFEVHHDIDVSDLADGIFYGAGFARKYITVSTGGPWDGNSYVYYRGDWLDGGGSVLSTTGNITNPLFPDDTKNWAFTVLYTLPVKPVGAVTFRLAYGIMTAAGNDGDVFYLDAVILSNGVANFFDGNSTGSYAWDGTTNLSRSYDVLSLEAMYDAYTDDNKIMSVNVGETTEITIETNIYPLTIIQPEVSDVFPAAPGTYVISASDDLIVEPDQWLAYGGAVNVEIGEQPGTLVVTLAAPPTEIPGVPGPYSLSVSDGGSSYATFSIVGTGLITDPITRRFSTGADPNKTAVEVALTFDSPFVSSLNDATDAAAKLMIESAGPIITMGTVVSPNELGAFTQSVGSVSETKNSIYRHNSISISAANAGLSSTSYVLADTIETLWASETAGDFDALWAGKTAGDFMVEPLRQA